MKNNKPIFTIKRLLLLIVAVILIFIVTFVLKINRTKNERFSVNLVFFDVGSGDSILIAEPGFRVLVDGGPSNQIDWHLFSNTSPLFCKINAAVVTHPHADHLFGLNRILGRCRVSLVFQNEVEYDSSLYKKWIHKTRNISSKIVYPQEIELNKTKIYVLWPEKNFSDTNLNNISTVLLVDYKNFEALLMGDLETEFHIKIKEHLQELNNVIDGKIDVYKVPHHGAKNGLNKEFLLWSQPKTAVVSVGENTYGHPSKSHLDFLEEVGAKVYRTDRDGTIIFKLP
jgi:beta-lactamase superfamily II metal-dependent hydrolase